jgi:hypothetical protein
MYPVKSASRVLLLAKPQGVVRGRADTPATIVTIPAAIPIMFGVIRKMIFCSTFPVVVLLTASIFQIMEIARVTAPQARKRRFVKA